MTDPYGLGMASCPVLTMEQIVAAQPAARMVVLARLETLWGYCSPELEPGVFKPDHRKAQLALQVVRELQKLFLIDQIKLQPPEPEPDEIPEHMLPRNRDTRMVLESLAELEERA